MKPTVHTDTWTHCRSLKSAQVQKTNQKTTKKTTVETMSKPDQMLHMKNPETTSKPHLYRTEPDTTLKPHLTQEHHIYTASKLRNHNLIIITFKPRHHFKTTFMLHLNPQTTWNHIYPPSKLVSVRRLIHFLKLKLYYI